MAALTMSACSLFTDLNGYAGGALAGDSGATDGPAGSATDAGRVDAAAPEGGDAGSLPFCASQSPAPFFCADFDDGRDPATLWDGTDLVSGTMTSDPAGRITSIAGVTLGWNARGHLDSMTPPVPEVRETYYVDPYHRQVLVQRDPSATPGCGTAGTVLALVPS